MDRQSLMQKIMELSFTLDDVALFLDTHPDDQAALEYFRKCVPMLADAVEQYEEQYGPLTLGSAAGTNRWTWAELPWPWEREA